MTYTFTDWTEIIPIWGREDLVMLTIYINMQCIPPYWEIYYILFHNFSDPAPLHLQFKTKTREFKSYWIHIVVLSKMPSLLLNPEYEYGLESHSSFIDFKNTFRMKLWEKHSCSGLWRDMWTIVRRIYISLKSCIRSQNTI